MKIDFYRHQLTPTDADSVAKVLATPFLTTGPVAREVESQLADYFDVPHGLLTNSWTNGALASLLAIGVVPGDEVIVPANTFVATANVVELAGATVVFADVDPATLLLTPELVAPHVTQRTRVVIPVHMYGQMCDVPGLQAMLKNHPLASGHIAIFEDAAHCFEGMRNGSRVGRHSDLAIFSFYATKNITCGEGGAIVTGNSELHGRLLEARLHGMSAMAADRFAGGGYNHWDMMRLGTKANLPDLLAALLPGQIATINARLPQRQVVADRYRSAFSDSPLQLVEQLDECTSAEHIFPIGIKNGRRDEAIALLNAAGVPVTVNYRSVPGTTYYRQRYGDLTEQYPISQQWGLDTLTLPLYPSLLPGEQEYIIEAVRRDVYPLLEG